MTRAREVCRSGGPGTTRTVALVFALLGAGVGPLSAEAPSVLAVPGRANAHVSMAADGRFVAVVWSGSVAGGATDVYAAVSRDAGATFSAPVRVNSTPGDARINGEQPPRVALIARGTEPEIAVIWTTKGQNGTLLMTARSVDAGRSFGTSTRVRGTEAPGNRGWTAIAADRHGATYAAWLDHRDLAAQESTVAAGRRHAHRAAPAAGHPDGVAMAALSKLYVARLDESAPVPVTGGVCYCCKTALAIGSHGALHAAWRHVYPGNLRDIAFSTSRDGGHTFDAPVRVSDDGWAIAGCPDDGPAMAVEGGGRAHVVWPTVITGDGQMLKTLFHASTVDGRTFTARQRIPTEGQANHPQIALAGDGSPIIMWDESGHGRRRVVLARGIVDADGGVRFVRQHVPDGQPALYPVAAVVPNGVLVAWTSGDPATSVIKLERLPAEQADRGHQPGGAGAAQQQHGAHMEHRFDDPERYAKSFDDPARDGWQMPDRVIEALDLRPGQSVADIGAGTGYFSVRLARAPAAPRVFAVDIEPAMVSYVRQRAAKEGLTNIVPVLASGEGPNLPDRVDVVLVVDTYHHIPDRVRYFRALRASLKPGARLAIVDFRKGAPSGPPEEFRFTSEQIGAELAAAGYTRVAQHDFLPRQLFLIFRSE